MCYAFRICRSQELSPCGQQGLSLRVPAGTSCAVVGTSGSGKSTLLRLLFRFYDPAGGAVCLGGRDVRDVRLQSLRDAIGIVPQARPPCT